MNFNPILQHIGDHPFRPKIHQIFCDTNYFRNISKFKLMNFSFLGNITLVMIWYKNKMSVIILYNSLFNLRITNLFKLLS